jgi:hypothetical protein
MTCSSGKLPNKSGVTAWPMCVVFNRDLSAWVPAFAGEH